MSRASADAGGEGDASSRRLQPKPAEPKPDPPEPQTHMVVDAPFIYRANDPVDLTENVAHLKMESKPMSFEPVVLPPPATSAKSAKPAKQPSTASGSSKPGESRASSPRSARSSRRSFTRARNLAVDLCRCRCANCKLTAALSVVN